MTIPISVEGYRQGEKELERLKQERPAIIAAIKDAREEGDLSENAGYDAARERQGFVEAKIAHLESRMAQFQVIDINTMDGDKAVFGATVELLDLDTGETRVYTLLGPDEADYASGGSISIQSPVGRAVLGKEAGDEVTVEAPRGRISYELVSVRFLGAKTLE